MRVLRDGLLVLLATLCAIEAVVRLWHPMPRTQVVREMRGVSLADVGGLPGWNIAYGEDLGNDDCLATSPERVVLFVGDSIFVTGSDRPPDDIFSEVLQARWKARGLPWCAVNVARPGFTGPLKVAAAKEAMAELDPDLVIYGIWNEMGEPWRLGDSVYELAQFRRDADGYPTIPWLPLPSFVHQPLFRVSEAYEYGVLALGHDRPAEEVQRAMQVAPVDALAAHLDTTKTPWWAVQLPALDAAFKDRVTYPHQTRARVLRHAATLGATPKVLAEALADDDVLALRADACCHYNSAGHARLADVFDTWISEAWTSPEGEVP